MDGAMVGHAEYEMERVSNVSGQTLVPYPLMLDARDEGMIFVNGPPGSGKSHNVIYNAARMGVPASMTFLGKKELHNGDVKIIRKAIGPKGKPLFHIIDDFDYRILAGCMQEYEGRRKASAEAAGQLVEEITNAKENLLAQNVPIIVLSTDTPESAASYVTDTQARDELLKAYGWGIGHDSSVSVREKYGPKGQEEKYIKYQTRMLEENGQEKDSKSLKAELSELLKAEDQRGLGAQVDYRIREIRAAEKEEKQYGDLITAKRRIYKRAEVSTIKQEFDIGPDIPAVIPDDFGSYRKYKTDYLSVSVEKPFVANKMSLDVSKIEHPVLITTPRKLRVARSVVKEPLSLTSLNLQDAVSEGTRRFLDDRFKISTLSYDEVKAVIIRIDQISSAGSMEEFKRLLESPSFRQDFLGNEIRR